MDNRSSTTFPQASGNAMKGDGTLHKVAASAHVAVDKVSGAADEVARKARPAIGDAAGLAHQAVDKAAGAAAPTAEWIEEQGKSLAATQKKLVADTCNYVAANPLKSLGIALIAGLLIGRIVL